MVMSLESANGTNADRRVYLGKYLENCPEETPKEHHFVGCVVPAFVFVKS